MKVIGPRVLVAREGLPTPSSSTIEVISYDNTPSQFARVVAVGNGLRLKDGTRRPIPLQVSDRVVLKPFSGSDVEVDGRSLVLVEEDDVLAIIAQ